MPPLEAWEKVLVSEDFLADRHFAEFFFSDCTWCHGGDDSAEARAEAHEGMDPYPSLADSEMCGGACHGDETEKFHTGLHYDNRGIVHPERSQVALRAGGETLPAVQEALGNHCSNCHTKVCGDCHISRPRYSEGGFVKGHVFYSTPKATLNCTGCHGSRIEKEMLAKGGLDFEGEVVDTKYDVHWNPNAMSCEECHGGHDADLTGVYHRYDRPDAPRCEDCHLQQIAAAGNQMHAVHALAGGEAPLLQCQVCHSQPYNNCRGCHLEQSEEGSCYFELDKSWLDFRIGKNPLKSEQRPYDYVVLRHVPIDRDTFSNYGDDLLTSFDALPTWKYATPHNVIKEIDVDGEPQPPPQARGCNGCHGHPELFLTAEVVEQVDSDELEANSDVIVDSIPEPHEGDGGAGPGPDGGPDGGV